jgi:hypothetical protein
VAPTYRARVGDIFRIPIDDHRVGMGQMIAVQPATYIAVFRSAYPAESRPDLKAIVKGRDLPAGACRRRADCSR